MVLIDTPEWYAGAKAIRDSLTKGPLRLYVPQWLETLAHGSTEAQQVALYALRSHDIEAYAVGFGDSFRWYVQYNDIEIVIDPEKKDDYSHLTS